MTLINSYQRILLGQSLCIFNNPPKIRFQLYHPEETSENQLLVDKEPSKEFRDGREVCIRDTARWITVGPKRFRGQNHLSVAFHRERGGDTTAIYLVNQETALSQEKN